LSLKASFAAPALYFPRCIDFINSGAIDLQPLISGTFPLEDTGANIVNLRDNKSRVIKSIMIND
jgi:L-iditol 2-dehydrogenase